MKEHQFFFALIFFHLISGYNGSATSGAKTHYYNLLLKTQIDCASWERIWYNFTIFMKLLKRLLLLLLC